MSRELSLSAIIVYVPDLYVMLWRTLIIGVLLSLQGLGLCQLANPNFEEGDPNSGWFTTPLNWQTDNYAALHSSFKPVLKQGHKDPNLVTWSIGSPSSGNLFLVLSTGDTEGLGSDPQLITMGRARSEEFFMAPGNTLYISYIFGTCDWFQDTAEIRLVPTDPNNYPNATEDIVLLSGTVTDTRGNPVPPPNIADYSSSGNWKQISYEIEPGQQGPYAIECLVQDQGDDIYKSYLAVDNVRYCQSSQGLGDINLDCTVNMIDYSIFASAWLATCTEDPNSPYYDPNLFICDPNIPLHESDFDNSFHVDSNDLMIFTDYWLEDFWVH